MKTTVFLMKIIIHTHSTQWERFSEFEDMISDSSDSDWLSYKVKMFVALQSCSLEKVFWKYTANLQENAHATLLKSHFGMGVLLQICCMISEHLFLRTPLKGYLNKKIFACISSTYIFIFLLLLLRNIWKYCLYQVVKILFRKLDVLFLSD